MANPRLRLPSNVAGDFFVDSTCIDCDTCRQLAPLSFMESGGQSCVSAQPSDAAARQAAMRALVSCPTGSIGNLARPQQPAAREVVDEFPLPITDWVFYCGFTSPDSFGASSYFVESPSGNWLVDSPRFVPHLRNAFERRGGLSHVFLTHRDDVADAAAWAKAFGAKRVIHVRDRDAAPDAEIVLAGDAPVELAPDFLAIPTPGHTAGHLVLLHRKRHLFTGDHMWWSRRRQRLWASRDVAWHSWPQQVQSVARLLDYEFDWVLPGHGERAHLAGGAMRMALTALVAELR